MTEHKLRSEGDATDIVEDIEQREGSVPPVPRPDPKQKQQKQQNAKAEKQAGAAKQTQP